jgi:hypothetical protein
VKFRILGFCGYAVAQLVKVLYTSRKVAGSISGGVSGIFHWHNLLGRTIALGSTQAVIEMSTRNNSLGWKRPVRRVDNLTVFMCRLSWSLRASTYWNPQGLSMPVMGLVYWFFGGFFENPSRTSTCYSTLTRLAGTSHQDLWTSMIKYRWTHLMIINVSVKYVQKI